MRRGTLLLMLVLLGAGCTRSFYRRSADRETYHALGQHMDESHWPALCIPVYLSPWSDLSLGAC